MAICNLKPVIIELEHRLSTASEFPGIRTASLGFICKHSFCKTSAQNPKRLPVCHSGSGRVPW